MKPAAFPLAQAGGDTAPMCASVPLREWRSWMRTAEGGARLIYAHGAVLDRQRDVVLAARSCAEVGAVLLFRRRLPGGAFEFIAERVRRAPATPARNAASAQPAPDSEAGQVLALLRRAANFGMACPTNAEIARAVRLRDAEAARYVIGQLIGQGHIRVENRGPRITRVVTIVATGKRTSAAKVAVGKGFGEARP